MNRDMAEALNKSFAVNLSEFTGPRVIELALRFNWTADETDAVLKLIQGVTDHCIRGTMELATEFAVDSIRNFK